MPTPLDTTLLELPTNIVAILGTLASKYLRFETIGGDALSAQALTALYEAIEYASLPVVLAEDVVGED
jgi:hypothetical protein